jgi:hypothetical protein
MISLILPYWDRQAAADEALASIAKLYSHLDLEVIVIDDGNPVPFRVPDTSLNLRVLTLPRKHEPKAPTLAWNEGVRAALGDVVILSCVEVIHTHPVLQQMANQVLRMGPKTYVLAAAWCPDDGKWHCHSSVKLPRNPEGTGLSFCAALRPALYWEAGGFDEEYREGAGYEDCDFINRMLAAGAKFVMRDDLKVLHPKRGATIAWGNEKFLRNEAIFYRKWPGAQQTTYFVTLQSGNYCGRGAEYVNVLFDMIHRNLPFGSMARFFCLTDDSAGLTPNIHPIALPADLEGWWGKLYLFKPGLFPDGARMVYFDLDTLIVGVLDQVMAYRGDCALLRDFYHPSRGAPGVMLWRAGWGAEIWEGWIAEGQPRNPLGDLGWIENLNQGRFTKRLDRLQDLYPGDFVSFKVHCQPYPPRGAKVICFHGQPKCHDAGRDWVELVWKIDGGGAAELLPVANRNRETVASNVRHACALPHRWLDFAPAHAGEIVLVGGGPSLKNTLPEIHWRAAQGQTIVALNNSGSFLIENGIEPHMQVVIDARPENTAFLAPPRAKRYFLASQCAPEVFDAVRGLDVTVFHMHTDGIADLLPSDGRPVHLVSSGTTVGLAAMVVAYILGYRAIHLHGFDSSFTDSHHAYPQPGNDADAVIDAVAGGRAFKTTAWMIMQTNQFQALAPALAEDGVVITVAGDGLLPYIAHCMSANLHLEAA